MTSKPTVRELQDRYYTYCKCGHSFPRGMASDYSAECPNCGNIVEVKKFDKELA